MNTKKELQKLRIVKSIINTLVFPRKLRLYCRKKINDKFIPPALNLFIEDLERQYSDYWIFSTFWPWGDFLMCCALLSEFKKKNGGKILVLYASDRQLDFINTFKFADETLKICPEFYFALCTNKSYSEHNKYGLTKGHIFEMSHHVYKEAETNKSSNFMELYAKMFNLSQYNMEKPTIPEEVQTKVKALYNEISQSKPLVLITPDAHSYDSKEISIEFWENLVSKLENGGYKVIFNTKRKNFEKFESIFLPLLETSYLATLCDTNISIRSGFTDIITIMGVDNQIILYPKSMRFVTITEEKQVAEIERCFNINPEKTFEETMFDVTSINNMFNKDFLELVVKDEEESLNKIIKNIRIKEEEETCSK